MHAAGEMPSESVRNFHRQILQRAAAALDRQPVDKREVLSVLVALEAEDVPRLKQKMRELAVSVADHRAGKPTGLYCLSQQLFCLDTTATAQDGGR